MNLIKSLWNDESGQGLTEYAVIIAIVSVALITLLFAFRDEIGRLFNDATTELNGAGVTQATGTTGG